ncbi:DMT family transporter [Halobacillus shinanisalinarum]|uniref:DMT family transporter n=1 Tax=Halobacillus shinanisalinarum TaxID=2932258 RepID=A0ABY4H295_9BACI|nr:DMT family transporter [Halobacillus shinanisalinarum]UOQ94464.1 DMT family transporter [Halobacillus shinanisalinarum]
MSRNRGITFVLLGAASFGFTPIFVKLGFRQGYTLGEINIIQMLIAFVVLWGTALVVRAKVTGLRRRTVLKIMMTGTFVGLTSIFYYGAIQHLTASLAIILLFQFVWIGIFFEWVFNKRKPTLLAISSMIVTLVGVFFASNILSNGAIELPAIGLIFGMLSAFTYAGFIFFSGQVAVDVTPWIRSPLMVTGSLILVSITFMKDVPSLPLGDLNLWIVGGGVAFFGGIIPPLFFAFGSPGLSDGLANVLSAIELPVALISANLILSESITSLQWLGVVFIIVAIFLNNTRGTSKLSEVDKQSN